MMVRDFVQAGADCSWTGTTTHDVGANLKEHVVPLEYRDLHGGNNTAACPATKLLYCDQRHTGPHRPRCSTASGRTAAHQGAACCWWWRLVFTSCRGNRKHDTRLKSFTVVGRLEDARQQGAVLVLKKNGRGKSRASCSWHRATRS